MKARLKAAWLEALRSGRYGQGHEYLRCADEYCCLGVLCDIYATEMGVRWQDVEVIERVWSLHEEELVLPDEVMAWAGLRESNPRVTVDGKSAELGHCNDILRFEFRVIADLIEEQISDE
jgi:hypothetical protein